MKLLLTSAGISNDLIQEALVKLLGKPISESTALFCPTAIWGIPGAPTIIQQVITGDLGAPFCKLGWKSIGLFELTALLTINRELWVGQVEQADALLVGGGDCQYLVYWMQQSGLTDLLPGLLEKLVYVGLSAGSMVLTSYGTTYGHHTLPASSDKCLSLLDFALHPHLDHPQFPDNSMHNLEKLAATLPMDSYLIDDETAIEVTDSGIRVISKGNWKFVQTGKK